MTGAAAVPGEPARICVLDADLSRLRDLEQLLKAQGHQVLCLNEVIGASNRIREFGADLLVVEVMMPTLSGPRLIEVLRRNLKNRPAIILYSALNLENLAAVANQSRADDYVVKNGDYLPLLNKVRFQLNLRSRP